MATLIESEKDEVLSEYWFDLILCMFHGHLLFATSKACMYVGEISEEDTQCNVVWLIFAVYFEIFKEIALRRSDICVVIKVNLKIIQ